MEGLGLVSVLVALFIGLIPFIALMCIWSNTGKAANLLRLMWAAECERDKREPVSGRLLADIAAERAAVEAARVAKLAAKAAKKGR
jgi:hypothetical protein